MSSYSGIPRSPDRAKAIAAVAAVHVALAAVILTGLNVDKVRAVVEKLQTFDIREVTPPPPPPPPAPQPRRATHAAGAPARRAQPAPIVAQRPKIPQPSPVQAAPVAGQGSASASGAARSGSGTGAGGSGNGTGGGDFSRFTPARLVRNLSRGDYRSIGGDLLPAGSADAAIIVSPSGSVSGCRLIRSSGNSTVDARLCPLVQQKMWFSPALDEAGRPIEFRFNFHANWAL